MKKFSIIFVLIFVVVVFAGCNKNNNNQQNQNQSQNQEQNKTNEQLVEEGKLIETEDGLVPSEEYRRELEQEMAKVEDEEMKRLQEDVDLANEMMDLEDDKKAGRKVKGSCNAIVEGSTCLEYYGSFWTDMQMKMNCEGSGDFSSSPCPSDMAGGCNTGYGTEADMVAWMYYRGEGGITPESLGYAKMACDATLGSKWLTMR